jgi:prolyl 4-hydroxylase
MSLATSAPSDPLPPEWMNWIRTNLQRGCRTGDISSQVRQYGFAEENVAAALESFRTQALPILPPGSAPPAVPDASYVPEASRIPRRNYIVLKDRTVRITARSDRPDVAAMDNLLSAEECDILVAASRAKIQRSLVVNPETGKGDVSSVRTSSGTFFQPGELAVVPILEARIAELTGVPANQGEGLQILNYQVGGQYLPHYDYFPPHETGSHEHLKSGGQRIATLVLYLNDVEAGGETSFPSAGNLRVAPKKGSAVYFAYYSRYGQLDDKTLHAGEPVIAGEKWIATKWLRQRACY